MPPHCRFPKQRGGRAPGRRYDTKLISDSLITPRVVEEVVLISSCIENGRIHHKMKGGFVFMPVATPVHRTPGDRDRLLDDVSPPPSTSRHPRFTKSSSGSREWSGCATALVDFSIIRRE